MTIQSVIYKKIQDPNVDKTTKNILKVVKAYMQRERDKKISDKVSLRIIKRHINDAKEMMTYDNSGNHKVVVDVLSEFLPKKADMKEVESWIRDNIDFSNYKNKMQAMGEIMRHFGTSVDGNEIRDLIQKMN